MYSKIDKYYNSQKELMNKKFDTDKNYTYQVNNNIIELFDNDKLIIKGEYQIVGIYNLISSIWVWGWNIQIVNRKLVSSSEKIKEFSEELMKEKKNSQEIDELYYITSNGNFYTSPNNIEKITKVALYYLEGKWIFPICYGQNNISCVFPQNTQNPDDNIRKMEYIMLTKII